MTWQHLNSLGVALQLRDRRSNSFYEKLKKEVQRAKAGAVSLNKEDIFKKYNFFLEYKLWEKNNSDIKMKKFDLKVDGLIKSLCK